VGIKEKLQTKLRVEYMKKSSRKLRKKKIS
jgi:hypothetical protein